MNRISSIADRVNRVGDDSGLVVSPMSYEEFRQRQRLFLKWRRQRRLKELMGVLIVAAWLVAVILLLAWPV